VLTVKKKSFFGRFFAKKMKNKVSACSNFENTPEILYRKLILTLNIVFKEACDYSSECGHFVDKVDQARTHKRELYLLRRKPYYTPTIFAINSLFKSFETDQRTGNEGIKKISFS
jgi:hypothetical protein